MFSISPKASTRLFLPSGSGEFCAASFQACSAATLTQPHIAVLVLSHKRNCRESAKRLPSQVLKSAPAFAGEWCPVFIHGTIIPHEAKFFTCARQNSLGVPPAFCVGPLRGATPGRSLGIRFAFPSPMSSASFALCSPNQCPMLQPVTQCVRQAFA